MIEIRHVHLVDDDEAIRRSIGFMLRTAAYDVTVYGSGADFLKESKSIELGCVLLDVRMPGMSGIKVQQCLIESGVACPVIVMTGHGNVSVAVEAMKAGAIDFIEKPFEKAQLVAALDVGFSQLGDRHAAKASQEAALIRIAALTPRERDVLCGLVKGHPNKTIAYDLGISPRTVEVYRANLMTKLMVHSLSAVLRLAFSAGLRG